MADDPATSSTALPAPPVLTATGGAPPDVPDTTSALYRAILGEVHAEYYLSVFSRIDAAERWQPHWNWAASLCTLSWLVFRQLWSVALYYAGIVVAGFLLIFGIGSLVFQFSSTVELVLSGAFIGALFAVPGLLGTTLLHADCRRRMTLALRSSNTDEEARLTLVGQASTRRRLGVLVAINTICAALIGLAAWQWLEFSASAGRLSQPAAPQVAPLPATPVPITPSSGPASPTSSPAAPSPATETPPTSAASSPASPSPSPSPSPTPTPIPTAAASAVPAPVATSASAPARAASAARPAAPSSAPRPVTGTAGRSAQGPVPWEAMKIAPPRPDIAPTPSIEPKKHVIESPWTGAASAPAAANRPPAPSKPEIGATTEKQLLINVGLFAVEDNARNVYNKLDAAGLPATLQPLTTAKGQRFRVRVGPYASRAEAQAAAAKIRALALEAVVIESPSP